MFNLETTFSAESTTDEVIKGHDLSDKIAVVTGASSELGQEKSRALASIGAQVVMVARNKEKLDAAMASIKAEQPHVMLVPLIMDLNDQRSVREAAATLCNDFSRIDLLINNAGVMACPLAKTAQGLESQFGCNHIGHFLLTCLLEPLLAKSKSARVICLSSAGHKMASVDLSDINYEKRPYDKWNAYGQSKSANALFALQLNKRLKKHVEAFSVHPGMIVTELGRHLSEEDVAMITSLGNKAKNSSPSAASTSADEGTPENKSAFKTIAQGAATSVWAATSETLRGSGGKYLENCQIAEANSQSNGLGICRSYC